MTTPTELPLTLSFVQSLFKLGKNHLINDSDHLIQFQSHVFSILAESDDEQKPDKLKAFISESQLLDLALPDQQLNQLILALLHQHRQDINPSTNHNSTNNNHNNNHNNNNQNHLPSQLLFINPNPSRLLTNRSRFQSRSPQTCSNSSSSAPSTPPSSARIASCHQPPNPPHSNPGPLPPSKPSFPSINLPWSDKLNASASEFKPSLSRAVSFPFKQNITDPSLLPALAPPVNSNHLWAYSPSSLENSHHRSPLQSPNHINNNNNINNNLYQQQHHHRRTRPTTPEIPRDPWLNDELDPKNIIIQPPNALSPNPVEFHPDVQDVAFGLFSPFQPSSPFKSPSLPPILTQPEEKIQHEPSCPTALQWGLSPEMAEEMAQFTAWDQSDSDGSLPPTIVHHLAEEDTELLGPNARYWMTPFDELSSTLAGTGVTAHQIEQALISSNLDISKALDWLLEKNGMLIHSSNLSPPLPLTHNQSLLQVNPTSTLSPSARDAISSMGGAAHQSHYQLNAGSLPPSPRFAHLEAAFSVSSQKRSKASSTNLTTDDSAPLELNSAHRICRFYLQGCCLRSDCKFSHDAGKAICRFWLKGNCLKGESRCDFLHEIPDVMNNDQAKQEEEENNKSKKSNAMNIKSFADEFPSLNESLLTNNRKSTHNNNNHTKVSRLRPVALLPDGLIDPSHSLLKLCQNYSAQFLEYSSRRKECFDLGKECFKRGDGAGVKKWSTEGDQWNKKLREEGRMVAGLIITERNRLMKDAVRELVSDRISKVDEAADRMQRGKEMGGGICLGVVKPIASNPSTTSSNSVARERMEVLMDLHGLQPEDGVYYLENFLMALKTEGYQGLAYVILTVTKPDEPSRQPPTSTTTTTIKEEWKTGDDEKILQGPEEGDDDEEDQAKGRRMEKIVKIWLEKKKFDWDSCPLSLPRPLFHRPSKIGIVCIDPSRKG